MPDLLRALVRAARSLVKTPAYTLLGVLTVALGVGATTAVFSMVNGVLLRRLPYANGTRVLRVTQPTADSDDAGFSVTEIADYRARLRGAAGVAEYHSMPFQVYGRGEPQRVLTGVVSDGFFSVLGVEPLLGRLFRPGEEAVGAPNVLVLSHRYWRERFGGDPGVVGQTFTMNDRVATVIGVLPPLPVYPDDNDIWMPAGACPFRSAPSMMARRDGRMLSMLVALRPGVTAAAAARELRAVATALHAEHPAAYPAPARMSIDAVGVREELTRPARRLVLTLLASATFVLVVAAANFSSLTLARQVRRARELALRTALGAGRGRIFRQLAAESLLVTLTGGALGVGLAYGGLGLLRAFAARVSPRAGEIALDTTVLAFAVVSSVGVGLAAALFPLARRRGPALAEELRASSAATTGSRHDGRTRGVLVAAQVAVAFVILTGAGLLVRSLIGLQAVDGGYDARDTMTARVDLNWSRYTTDALQLAFADELLARLGAGPGVVSVAVASDFPLNDGQPSSVPFAVRGREPAPGAPAPRSDVSVVSPDYFRTIGVPLLRGRALHAADRDSAGRVAVVSRRLAETHWRGVDPVGQQLSLDDGRSWLVVVGVVGDVAQNGPAQGVRDQIYLSHAASPPGDLRVLVRTRPGGAAGAAVAIRAAVRAIDDRQPVVAVQTLDALRGARLAEPRVTTALVASFALVALVITAGGLAGVVANAVSQRVAEIGIRVALGADAGDVLRLVLRGGARLVLGGLAAGVAAALAVTPLAGGLLFGVTATDPVTFAAVAVALFGVGMAACWVPARSALRVDPVQALRAR